MATFQGRVVFVTGASSGIGAAVARVFARAGADVALVARRQDRIDALSRELTARGRRALAIRGDVTVDGELEHAVRATRDALGRVDVVIANAGFSVMGRLDALTIADYRRQFETNVFGVLRTIYASLDALRESRGCLAIVGSVSGHVALPGGSAYAMSKFAVRALATALRHELAPQGVGVVLVSPGFVESEIQQVDNRGVWHPHARTQTPAWLRMSADRAARQIMRAVARRERERVITGHGKAAVLVQRHAPWVLDQAVRRFALRSRSGPVPSRG